jgi:16S rRNA (uracil1498-N3)-methyltransferase
MTGRHVHRVFVAGRHQPGSEVELAPTDRRHLERVLRLVPGAHMEVVDEGAVLYAATVTGPGRVMLGEVLAAGDAEPGPALWLALASARADVAVEKATELGARSIGALVCERSKGEARLDRWRRLAEAAARQAKRRTVPAVLGPASFAAVVGEAGAIVLDHEDSAAVPFAAGPEAVILVGPEAGLTDAEREAARAAGAPLARLGVDGVVLRSETAALAATALARFATFRA